MAAAETEERDGGEKSPPRCFLARGLEKNAAEGELAFYEACTLAGFEANSRRIRFDLLHVVRGTAQRMGRMSGNIRLVHT